MAAEVRWLGDESCRRELEVREQVETMTARPVSSVEIADFELNVKSLAQDRWTLELTTVRREDGARSTRAIKGATCNEVTDAVAVAIALAIGPKEPVSKAMNEPKAAPKPRLAAPPRRAGTPRKKNACAPELARVVCRPGWWVGFVGHA